MRLSGMFLTGTAAFLSLIAHGESVEGFVTTIGSPSDFNLSALHVVMDGKTHCATETLDAYITWRDGPKLFTSVRLFDVVDLRESKSRKTQPCTSVGLAVGRRIHVVGAATGPSFLATQVTVFDVKLEPLFIPDSMDRQGAGGALLEETPQLSRTDQGWTGTMWLNGYPMAITPATELLTAPSGTRLSYRPPGSHVKHPRVVEALAVPALKASRWDAEMPKGPAPPFTPSLFQANTWTLYRGGTPQNGQLPLESIRFWSNDVDENENKYLAEVAPLVRDPDYAGRVPGTVGFQGEGQPKSVEILADQAVQKYVTALGVSLIPEYQRALPEQDKAKIHFRFYVVQGERPLQVDEMEAIEGLGAWSQKRLDAGAVAFPNGVILLPDYLLTKIGNEAQLATILSDQITTVVQKQGYIGRGAWSDLGLWEDLWSPSSGYDPSLALPLLRSEQAQRIGIRQMYLAGYDIREAPVAWAAVAGKQPNPFPKKKRGPAAVPWYTSYSFDYISRFYADVDFGKLKRGEPEYAQFLDELRRADPAAFAEAK